MERREKSEVENEGWSGVEKVAKRERIEEIKVK